MSAEKSNALVRRELDTLFRERLIDESTHAQIAARYSIEKWNWHSLSRWFLIFGAITFAAGIAIASRDWFVFTLEKLAVGLAILVIAMFFGARKLLQRSPPLPWSARALELTGGLTIIGLTFTLGAIYSTGSGNWPALLAIDLAILLALSYSLHNILLLVLSSVVFFCWFGGFTGYSSGWHAYWFGMNYPLRFLIAATGIVAMGVMHLRAEANWLAKHTGFAKVWISAGLYFAEMALWLLSLFGNFNLDGDWSRANTSELFAFNVLWIGLNVALMLLGNRRQARMLTGYGATFLIIQIYTLFFAHLADDLGLFLSLFISGGGALAGVMVFESKRRANKAEAES
jgi:uncharacterized membrane protein